MGLLVNGSWVDQWYNTDASGGRFVRQDARFRQWVTADGSSPVPAEAGRYHLYVSWACPWAHRTLIFRVLKGLEAAVSVSVVHPDMLSQGWTFRPEEGYTDDLFGAAYFHEVYTRAAPDYTGRVTVPVLWDKVAGTIVSNESSEIIRMFNGALGTVGTSGAGVDYYPPHLRAEIDAINADVYENVNNGVYRAGFATTQEAYEEGVEALFAALDRLEDRLSRQPWLVGGQITEADWRLFTTLYRFDPVYYSHFKCARRRVQDYPALWRYTRRLYAQPGVAETCKMADIRRHYFYSHETINPRRIVPVMPEIDYRLSAEEATV